MRVCYLRVPGVESAVTGRWADALGAEPSSLEQLRAQAEACHATGSPFPYRLVLAAASPAASQVVLECRQLLERLTGCRLLLHLDRSPPQQAELSPYRALLAAADLVITTDYDVSLDLAQRLGVQACAMPAPFPIEDVRPRRRRARRPTLLVVARASYGWAALARDIGFSTYLVTRLRHRIVALAPGAEQLPDQVANSDLVYLPEPIDDGGALAARCAASGSLLIANARYDAAKITFPYTTFDAADARRRMTLFFWLYTSPEFASFFRESARWSAAHFSAENRRVELLRKLQYRFPEGGYEARVASTGSLLDQIRHRSGPRQIEYGEDECVAVCLVRNGQEHLPSFLGHHRSLGVRHFIFVDNGSNDATLAMLDRQADVTVYESALPHKYYENELRRLIIEEHCRHRFCLNVDVDELFDYPASDRLSLGQLLRYLRRRGATAMAAYMLDMYAKENRFSGAEPLDLASAYPYYDVSNITRLDYFTSHVQAYCDRNVLLAEHVKCYFGGIRKTIFKSKTGGHYLLTKHPLIYLDGQLEPVTNPHYCNKATVADVTGVIRHYKFTPSFKAKVIESRAAKRYVKFAQNQYEEYHRKIGGEASIRIDTPGTRYLTHVDQLVREGFVATSPAYEAYVRLVTSNVDASTASPRAPAAAEPAPSREAANA